MTGHPSSAGQPSPHTSPAAALAVELRRFVGRLRRRLQEETDAGGLSGPQISVIGLLEKSGTATVTTLAREEGMRPQSMGAIIATLEAAGFVRGTPDPADGRQTILSLTPAAWSWIEAGRAARQDFLTRAIETRLTTAQMSELGSALATLKTLIDP
jgi:DNA-binding MarR family transcriptional regulator